MIANVPRREAVEVVVPLTRRCTRCVETLRVDQFPAGGKWCKTCRAEYSRDYFARRGKSLRRLRVVAEAEGERRAPVEEIPACVCGALQVHHRNGEGACAATNCPKFFERGL